MLRYEWVWYKSRCTGFLNARRAPLKRTENILVFYQKLPYYDPQFEQGKPYKKISRTGDNSPNYGKFLRSSSGSEDGLRFPGNLLAFSSVQRTIHPTQKPVQITKQKGEKAKSIKHRNEERAKKLGIEYIPNNNL